MAISDEALTSGTPPTAETAETTSTETTESGTGGQSASSCVPDKMFVGEVCGYIKSDPGVEDLGAALNKLNELINGAGGYNQLVKEYEALPTTGDCPPNFTWRSQESKCIAVSSDQASEPIKRTPPDPPDADGSGTSIELVTIDFKIVSGDNAGTISIGSAMAVASGTLKENLITAAKTSTHWSDTHAEKLDEIRAILGLISAQGELVKQWHDGFKDAVNADQNAEEWINIGKTAAEVVLFGGLGHFVISGLEAAFGTDLWDPLDKLLGITNIELGADANVDDIGDLTVKSQVLYKEQCYLLAKIFELVNYKKNTKEKIKPKKLPYVPSRVPKNQSMGNACLMAEGDPYGFLNKLTQYTNYKEFFAMTNAEISSLVPMIRLFKIRQDDGGRETQIELKFASNFGVGVESPETYGKTDMSDLLSNKLKRGFGAGIKDFTFTYDGSDPFSTKKSIKATLKIFANSFDELLVDRGGYSYIDLALKTGSKISEKTKQALSCQQQKKEQELANLNKLNFRLKVVAGWAKPTANTILSGGVSDALNNSHVTLNLTPTIHEFDIDEMGRVNFTINYLAYIDDFFDQPNFNIFADPDVSARATMRKIAFKKLSSECRADQVSELKKDHRDQIANEKYGSLAYITRRLIAEEKLQYISLSREQLINFTNLGPWADLPAVKVEEDFATAAAAAGESVQADGQKVLPDKDKEGSTKSDGAPAEEEKYGFDQSMLNVDQTQIPFFFVSDLVDTILAGMEKNFLDLPKNLDKEKKEFKNNFPNVVKAGVTIRSADVVAEKEKIEKFANRFKSFRVLLGPLEIVNPTNNAESAFVNFGDLPVSLKYFTSWLTEKMLKREVVTYSLSAFLKDLFNNLINDFLSNDSCFKVSTKQKIFLNQSSLTAYKNTGSKYDEITDEIARQNRKASRLYTSFARQPILNISGVSLTEITQKPVTEEINYMTFYAGRTQPTELMNGNREKDENRGLFHYTLGRDRGIVKTISLSKTTATGLKEVRFEQEGYDGLEQLREVYDINIKAFPIVNAFPGTYIFVDPHGWSPDSGKYKGEQNFDLTKLGIGGYYMIIRSEHSFASGVAETGITAKWVAQITKENEKYKCARPEESTKPPSEDTPTKCTAILKAREKNSKDTGFLGSITAFLTPNLEDEVSANPG
jgi:hypothetical protein